MALRIIAFLALALAMRGILAQSPPAAQCATPPVQCCTTLAPADNPTVAMVLKGLGIVPEDPKKLSGLTCSDIQGTFGPGGNATCAMNFSPVCCGQKHDGLDVDCVVVDTTA